MSNRVCWFFFRKTTLQDFWRVIWKLLLSDNLFFKSWSIWAYLNSRTWFCVLYCRTSDKRRNLAKQKAEAQRRLYGQNSIKRLLPGSSDWEQQRHQLERRKEELVWKFSQCTPDLNCIIHLSGFTCKIYLFLERETCSSTKANLERRTRKSTYGEL